MTYKSFETNKKKLEKINNKSIENNTNLKKIPLRSLDFNSINLNKSIETITLISTKLYDSSEFTSSFLLKNFPSWSINFIEPIAIYSISEGFNLSNLVENFFIANANGTLKEGDISIINQDFNYWINNIDELNYLLKVFFSVNIRQAQLSQFGFSTIQVPTYFKIELKIYNYRIYQLINEKKS